MQLELKTVYLGIGANQGRRIYALKHAVDKLRNLSERPVKCSAVYETKPVGYLNQPDFLNMVAQIETRLHPLDVLRRVLAIETEYGRTRTIRFGPRTLDIDVLLYGSEYICFRDLQVPHPRMWERAFVVVPLADLSPQISAPGGRTVGELANVYLEKGDVRYVGNFW